MISITGIIWNPDIAIHTPNIGALIQSCFEQQNCETYELARLNTSKAKYRMTFQKVTDSSAIIRVENMTSGKFLYDSNQFTYNSTNITVCFQEARKILNRLAE